jgi:hypothetical protein
VSPPVYPQPGPGPCNNLALAYNLRRVLNLVSFTELMAAVAA